MPSTSFLRRLWHSDMPRTVTLALVVAGACIALAAAGLGPIHRLDHQWLDTLTRMRAAAPGPQMTDTVVVDVDDVSLAAVGQWPWPRYRVGAMLERVAAAAPRAIGLDIVFPEADRTSLSSIRSNFQREFGLDIGFTGVPQGLEDNDGFLGEIMSRSNAVAAHYFYFDHRSAPDAPLRSGLRIEGRTDKLRLPEPTGALVNASAIAAQTHTSGFMNSGADPDGVVRRVPLLLRYDGVVHPSLALATTMRALGIDSVRVAHDWQGLWLQLGARRVPIAADGTMLLRFDGPARRYSLVSAVDVLNGRARDSDFAGKLVFIGSSAVGTNDLHLTAVDARFPGLKIQSVVAENLLRGAAVAQPPWSLGVIAVLSLATALLMAAVSLCSRGILPVLGFAVLAVAVAFGVSVELFTGAGIWLSPITPLVVAIGLFGALFTHRLVAERNRADAARRQLENARQVTIESMAAVAETRDPETGAHIKRTQHYVRAIAERMRRDGLYLQTLTPGYIQLLFLSAPLHDIGKVGVPDRILLKPGRLNDDEMVLMKEHAEYGRRIVLSTSQRIDGDNFLLVASDIAATHHEKWDGTGYPLGLAGNDIPLAGRIMAVADVYDALISRRCYKEPFTHAHSTDLMRAMRGTNFDPAVLDAFFSIENEIIDIANRFRDDEVLEMHDVELGASELVDRPEPRPQPPVPFTPPPVVPAPRNTASSTTERAAELSADIH